MKGGRAPAGLAGARYIMARKKGHSNTNFRLGLNRAELIEAAQMFGKKLSVAKKDSTKRLEEYIMNKIGGRGSKIPDFTEQQKKEVREATRHYGLEEGLHLLGYRVRKITGQSNEQNFLRLSIARSFAAFYDKGVRKEHIDELMTRIPKLERDRIISGVMNLEPYYVDLFEEYAEELAERERR